ncbi:MAG: aldehyde dehydrogenase (NADP(+)) [Chloroflexota bacterium]
MGLQPVLINGTWRQDNAPEGSFRATNPATRQFLPDEYPVSALAEIELAIEAAHVAMAELRLLEPDVIARFLDLYADNIEARREELVELANLETALPKEPRLNSVELPRTTNQLRQAASAVRDRSWRHATIDTKTNIRSIYMPLDGPVAVFGPNNFPFAFNSVAGGDFAAAIAAGNPVIAKANPSHPGTTRMLAEAAFEAVIAAGLPRAMVQMLYRVSGENGLKLVSHSRLGATGFTGSRRAGMQLKDAADRACKPIYLEMSSINPVFVLPGALEERAEAVAAELITSCLMGAGQFCTNPGLVVLLDDDEGRAFMSRVASGLSEAPVGVLLGERGPGHIREAIGQMKEEGAEIVVGGDVADTPGYGFHNTLLKVSGDTFLQHPDAMQTEAFGTVSLFVLAKDEEQMVAIANSLDGNLTGTIYSHTGGADDALYDLLEPALAPRVGRLLNDKVPTGVTVSPGMVHGGPPPSTGHPGFTAVGIPNSLVRFAALRCYDNVRLHRLPNELRNENPTGKMWRSMDGQWTTDSV